MKIVLGLIVIIGTLVIAGRQPANKLSNALGILLLGFMLLSAIAQIPYSNSSSVKDNYSYSGSYSLENGSSYAGFSYTRNKALTKEEAEVLRGTGYKGTHPNSAAESMELKAAQVKCKECGYHSDNGSNSLCDYCQAKTRD